MKRILFSIGLTCVLLVASFASVFSQGRIEHRMNPNPQPDGTIHFTQSGRIKAALTTGGTTATAPLIDHGGPVINTPTIYIIWYGNWNQSNGTDTAAGKQIVRDWANGVGGTPHFALNTTYGGKAISGTVFFGGETTDTGTKTRLTDNNIRTVVSSAISSNRLPYNPSGVYFVVTSSNVTASSGFCTQYCGWHTHSNISGIGNVRYAFVGNAARCITSCAAQSASSPNGNPGIDGSVSVLTHELEEATTDPDLNAWYASSGAENADTCAWTFGHFQFQVANGSWANLTFGGRNWLIQRNLMRSGNSWFCMVDSTHN